MNEARVLTKDNACHRIQRAWRAYTNKKVYKYYKDLILLKTAGNPRDLLKAINPNEAQLLETAANLHIRFRLGGARFPPTIYYKIYTHGALVDINSFAPRDYSSISRNSQPVEKMYLKQYQEQKIHHDGWYLRAENNGWRPLQHKFQKTKDFVEVTSANKVKYFHHNKNFRQQKQAKHKRLNKIRWFQKMYEEAKKGTDAMENQENPFNDTKFLDLDDQGFDDEVKELLEWSENLDFDKYYDDWQKISTSDKTENYTNSLKINSTAPYSEYENKSIEDEAEMQYEIAKIPSNY